MKASSLLLFTSKGICIAFLLLFILNFSGYGQNLITNTQAGITTESTEKTTPNRIATWVQHEKAHAIPTTANLFQIRSSKENTDFQSEVRTAVYLDLEQDMLAELSKTQPELLVFNVPVAKNKSFELELLKVDNVTADFQLRTSEGENITQAEIGGVFYRGIVKNDTRSLAALSIFPDHLQLVIADRADNYVLAALPSDEASKNEYVLYAERDLLGRPKAECLAETKVEQFKGTDLKKYNTYEKSAEERCLEVYIECDFDLFNDTGSDPISTAQYAQAVFNVSATIYQNEGIDKEISEIFVWTTRDPFRGLNFTSAVLGEFILSKASSSFPGNYAHFVTSRFGRSGVAASFECNLPFALTSFIVDLTGGFPTPSIDVAIFAHEMGHNMGSLHTHGCYWNSDIYGLGTQIDDCGNANRVEGGGSPEGRFCVQNAFEPIIPEDGGTIMSYCDQGSFTRTYPGTNFEFGFGPQPGDIIRMNYNNPAKGCNTLNEPQANLNCTRIDSVAVTADSLTLFGLRIENQGEIAVGASNIGIYLSDNELIYPGIIRAPLDVRQQDSLIGVVPIGGLNVGESVTLDASIDIADPSILAGQYFVGAYANYDRIFDEGNLGDNGIAYTTATVDLLPNIRCINNGTIAVEGTSIVLSDFSLENTGNYTTRPASIGLLLSEDSIIAPNDNLLATYFLPSIAPNDTVSVNQRIDLRDYSVVPGTYFIAAVLDPFGALPVGAVDSSAICVLTNVLEYTVEPADQFCQDETFTAAQGTITDGSGTATAQFGTLCRKTISPDIGGRIELNFTELNLMTARDFVIFYDGANLNDFIGAFTGDILPDSTITARNDLQVFYIGLNGSEGWSADYEVTQPDVDVELNITASSNTPRPLQTVEYTFEVRNAGFRPVTNVMIQHNLADGKLQLVEDAAPVVSTGRYSASTNIWTLPLLPPSRTATLKLKMVASTDDFQLYAQVIRMLQDDGDSTPNNGSCCTVQEDDEAVFSPNIIDPEGDISSRSVNLSANQLHIQGLFPNPVQLETTLLFYSPAQNIQLSLQDVNGRIVHRESWPADEGMNYKQLDLSQLSAGTYFLRLNDSVMERLVKME